MSEDKDWRSESAYSYIDTLTPGELAWEFLRRNPDYRKAREELLNSGTPSDEGEEEFAHQWGLRFRAGSSGHSAQPANLLVIRGRSIRHRSQHFAHRSLAC